MREIEFKAIKKYDIERKRKWTYSKSLLHSQESGNLENITMLKNDGIWCEIKPETLCEYTGKECNGKKIFVGDYDEDSNQVVFSDDYLGYFVLNTETEELTPLYDTPFEPIGNIHDAKE